jgi:predicted transcriptional regulator
MTDSCVNHVEEIFMEFHLSERQKIVYDVLLEGPITGKDLAKRLNIGWATCRNHLSHLYRKGINVKKKLIPNSNSYEYWIDPDDIKTGDTIIKHSQIEMFGNRGHVDARLINKPLSLQELLELFKVDTRIWKAENYRVNVWPVGAKHPETGEIITKDLYQTKANLIKRFVEPVKFKALKKIKAAIPLTQNITEEYPEQMKVLLLADSHMGFRKDIITGSLEPFHDRRIWDIAVYIATIEQPNAIILLGDMIDLPDWSDKFLKSPEFYWTTQPTLIEMHYWLTKLRIACPKSRIIYIEGNHENRMPKSIITHQISAYNLKPADKIDGSAINTVDTLLALDSLKVEYLSGYPKNSHWLSKYIICTHSDSASSASGKTTSTLCSKVDVTTIVGHIHRQELATKTVKRQEGNKYISVFCPGTMARIDGVVPSGQFHENWQQGIALLHHDATSGEFNIEPLSIQNGIALYRGMKLTGRDLSCELKKLYKQWKF